VEKFYPGAPPSMQHGRRLKVWRFLLRQDTRKFGLLRRLFPLATRKPCYLRSHAQLCNREAAVGGSGVFAFPSETLRRRYVKTETGEECANGAAHRYCLITTGLKKTVAQRGRGHARVQPVSV
jgi:hypothetical protein